MYDVTNPKRSRKNIDSSYLNEKTNISDILLGNNQEQNEIIRNEKLSTAHSFLNL